MLTFPMGSVVVVRWERGMSDAMPFTLPARANTYASRHTHEHGRNGHLRSPILPTTPHPPPPPPPPPPSLVLVLIWVVKCVDTRLSAPHISSCMTCRPDVIVRSAYYLFFPRFKLHGCPAAHAAGAMAFPPSGDGLYHLFVVLTYVCVPVLCIPALSRCIRQNCITVAIQRPGKSRLFSVADVCPCQHHRIVHLFSCFFSAGIMSH